jgi:uncharacterized membrane protein YhaH (DUF805 family)
MEALMNTAASFGPEGVSRRIAFWTALLTIHAVFLAAAFAVVFATHLPAGSAIAGVGFLSLFGILVSLLLLAEAVTVDDEKIRAPKTAAFKWYAKHRPVVWLCLAGLKNQVQHVVSNCAFLRRAPLQAFSNREFCAAAR